MDKLTNMMYFAPLKIEASPADAAQAFVEYVWKLHGMPMVFTTDRGTECNNKFADEVLQCHWYCALQIYFLPPSDGWTKRTSESSTGRNAEALHHSQDEQLQCHAASSRLCSQSLVSGEHQ